MDEMGIKFFAFEFWKNDFRFVFLILTPITPFVMLYIFKVTPCTCLIELLKMIISILIFFNKLIIFMK